MLRLFAQLAVATLANALGLLAAATIFDNFSIDATSFVVAVLIFSISVVVLGPLVLKIALTNAPYLVGGIALVTTLASLALTNLLSDGISINGLSAWVGSTVIVWIFSTVGNLLLPLVIFKKTLEKAKEK
jgi:putative membrane protein